MSVQTNLSTPHRAADLGRGAVALVGVVALVVGVPVALLTWVGSPLPAEVPTLSEVTGAVRDGYISDAFLLKTLALVCWLVWTELTASLLVEAVAYARGRKAGVVPLAGGLQRGAARLIAAVALLGAVVATKGLPERSVRASQPLAPVSQPVVALVVDDGSAHPDAAVPGSAPDAVPGADVPTYEVQRRDTLWDIAERHLGDPFRWQEIFRLNEGRPQADGRCLTDPDLIMAGWQLQLPGDAAGLAPAPPHPAPEPPAPSAPAPTSTPALDPASPVVEGGMVLIDHDGQLPVGGDDVVLVSESSAVPGRRELDGMVLLPDDGSRDQVPGELASRPDGLAGPPPRAVDDD